MTAAKRLVVAQLVDDLHVGGMERAAVNLANGLADLGHESRMISTRGAGALEACVNESVHTWRAERRGRWDIAGLRRIAAYIDEHGLDIIHSHNQYSSYLTRVVLRMCKCRPLHIVTDQNGPGLHNRRQAVLDTLMLRRVDGYVAVTEALRDRAERLLSLPDERCIYVINGIKIFHAG